jgi:hypothetical protein
MSPIRSAAKAVEGYAKAERKLLRMAGKLNCNTEKLSDCGTLFPRVSDDQVLEIAKLAKEMDDLMARAFDELARASAAAQDRDAVKTKADGSNASTIRMRSERARKTGIV